MTYLQGFLIQVLIYSAVWLVSEYTGLLLSLIMAAIFGALWIFALVIELVEKSKVPRSFFVWMFLSIWPPLLVSGFFSVLYQGNFDWL